MTAIDSQTAKMSHKQEKAIAALLSEKTIAAAALTAGIGEATLLRWLKDEPFATAYREARREVVTQAVSQLQRASGEAVDTLREVASDASAPASSRVAAARVILDTAIRAVELEDLAVRVERLEELLQETNHEPKPDKQQS